MPITPGELAEQIGGTLINGEPSTEVGSVATLQHASPGDISHLVNCSYRKYLASTRAGVVILAADDVGVCPVAAIVADHPQSHELVSIPRLYRHRIMKAGIRIARSCGKLTSLHAR